MSSPGVVPAPDVDLPSLDLLSASAHQSTHPPNSSQILSNSKPPTPSTPSTPPTPSTPSHPAQPDPTSTTKAQHPFDPISRQTDLNHPTEPDISLIEQLFIEQTHLLSHFFISQHNNPSQPTSTTTTTTTTADKSAILYNLLTYFLLNVLETNELRITLNHDRIFLPAIPTLLQLSKLPNISLQCQELILSIIGALVEYYSTQQLFSTSAFAYLFHALVSHTSPTQHHYLICLRAYHYLINAIPHNKTTFRCYLELHPSQRSLPPKSTQTNKDKTAQCNDHTAAIYEQLDEIFSTTLHTDDDDSSSYAWFDVHVKKLIPQILSSLSSAPTQKQAAESALAYQSRTIFQPTVQSPNLIGVVIHNLQESPELEQAQSPKPAVALLSENAHLFMINSDDILTESTPADPSLQKISILRYIVEYLDILCCYHSQSPLYFTKWFQMLLKIYENALVFNTIRPNSRLIAELLAQCLVTFNTFCKTAFYYNQLLQQLRQQRTKSNQTPSTNIFTSATLHTDSPHDPLLADNAGSIQWSLTASSNASFHLPHLFHAQSTGHTGTNSITNLGYSTPSLVGYGAHGDQRGTPSPSHPDSDDLDRNGHGSFESDNFWDTGSKSVSFCGPNLTPSIISASSSHQSRNNAHRNGKFDQSGKQERNGSNTADPLSASQQSNWSLISAPQMTASGYMSKSSGAQYSTPPTSPQASVPTATSMISTRQLIKSLAQSVKMVIERLQNTEFIGSLFTLLQSITSASQSCHNVKRGSTPAKGMSLFGPHASQVSQMVNNIFDLFTLSVYIQPDQFVTKPYFTTISAILNCIDHLAAPTTNSTHVVDLSNIFLFVEQIYVKQNTSKKLLKIVNILEESNFNLHLYRLIQLLLYFVQNPISPHQFATRNHTIKDSFDENGKQKKNTHKGEKWHPATQPNSLPSQSLPLLQQLYAEAPTNIDSFICQHVVNESPSAHSLYENYILRLVHSLCSLTTTISTAHHCVCLPNNCNPLDCEWYYASHASVSENDTHGVINGDILRLQVDMFHKNLYHRHLFAPLITICVGTKISTGLTMLLKSITQFINICSYFIDRPQETPGSYNTNDVFSLIYDIFSTSLSAFCLYFPRDVYDGWNIEYDQSGNLIRCSASDDIVATGPEHRNTSNTNTILNNASPNQNGIIPPTPIPNPTISNTPPPTSSAPQHYSNPPATSMSCIDILSHTSQNSGQNTPSQALQMMDRKRKNFHYIPFTPFLSLCAGNKPSSGKSGENLPDVLSNPLDYLTFCHFFTLFTDYSELSPYETYIATTDAFYNNIPTANPNSRYNGRNSPTNFQDFDDFQRINSIDLETISTTNSHPSGHRRFPQDMPSPIHADDMMLMDAKSNTTSIVIDHSLNKLPQTRSHSQSTPNRAHVFQNPQADVINSHNAQNSQAASLNFNFDVRSSLTSPLVPLQFCTTLLPQTSPHTPILYPFYGLASSSYQHSIHISGVVDCVNLISKKYKRIIKNNPKLQLRALRDYSSCLDHFQSDCQMRVGRNSQLRKNRAGKGPFGGSAAASGDSFIDSIITTVKQTYAGISPQSQQFVKVAMAALPVLLAVGIWWWKTGSSTSPPEISLPTQGSRSAGTFSQTDENKNWEALLRSGEIVIDRTPIQLEPAIRDDPAASNSALTSNEIAADNQYLVEVVSIEDVDQTPINDDDSHQSGPVEILTTNSFDEPQEIDEFHGKAHVEEFDQIDLSQHFPDLDIDHLNEDTFPHHLDHNPLPFETDDANGINSLHHVPDFLAPEVEHHQFVEELSEIDPLPEPHGHNASRSQEFSQDFPHPSNRGTIGESYFFDESTAQVLHHLDPNSQMFQPPSAGYDNYDDGASQHQQQDF